MRLSWSIDNLSGRQVRFEQSVQMDDYISHLGVIDAAMRLGTPRVFRTGVIGIDADEVKPGQIGEFQTLRIADAPTHDEMKFLHWLPDLEG